MSILSKDELESLDMARILKELTPLEEKLLEAYKELEARHLRELAQAKEELEVERNKYEALHNGFEMVCDENATLKAELEEANKLVCSLDKELSEVKEELGMYTGRQ